MLLLLATHAFWGGQVSRGIHKPAGKSGRSKCYRKDMPGASGLWDNDQQPGVVLLLTPRPREIW